MNKIIFAAGGTGGHIYPAIAIADELKKIKKDIGIKFIGAEGRIEEKIIPLNGYELSTIEISGFKRNFTLSNLKTLYRLRIAINESKFIMRDFKPDLVYGTGGFVSGPVLRAASTLGIPTVIQNGDYYPGLTVRMVAKKADKVILNFRESEKYFSKKDNLEYFSYPVRQNLARHDKNEALDFFYMDAGRKTILITGGSQGAVSVNNCLLKIHKYLLDNGIQMIWQTGINNFEKVKNAVGENKYCNILSYIDNMSMAYSAADLVIARAGISTIMELASFGIPVLFIPYPYASANHQEKNARRLVESNAADIILDKEMEMKLKDKIISIINDNEKLAMFRQNITNFADRLAAFKIADFLLKNYN